MEVRKRVNHENVNNIKEEYGKHTDILYYNKCNIEKVEKLKRVNEIRKDSMNKITHFFICSKVLLLILFVIPIAMIIYFILLFNSINQNDIFYLKQIIKSSLTKIDPKDLVIKSIHENMDNILLDKNRQNIHIIAFGKAAFSMIIGAENELGRYVSSSIASIPCDVKIPKVANLKTVFFKGGKNNLPDKDSLEATNQINNFINNIPKDDVVLILISGGGSALLPAPIPGVTLEEKFNITKLVAANSADIRQLNIVRQSLSTMKGGQLVEKLYPRKVISLILSDIVGDPVQYIASGPTYISESIEGESRRIGRYQEAISVLKELNLFTNISSHILEAMKMYAYDKDNIEDKTILNDGRIQNYIIGNNMKGLQILRDNLMSLPYDYCIDDVTIVTDSLEGNVEVLAKNYCIVIKKFLGYGEIDLSFINSTIKPYKIKPNQTKIGFLFGGEWVIKLNKNNKNGIGGRNQHLVLEVLSNLINQIHNCSVLDKRNFKLLSFNTDGFDGPTLAAGAMIDGEDLVYFLSRNSSDDYKEIVNDDFTKLNITTYLDNRNSFEFWEKYKNSRNHIVTGRTNTNFMDITILILEILNN
uniref:Glycerate kinase (inferred by orthology to a human protein) n=1 Tax=Strongyloides venezuelensis TaxID=75913 RepID=A0A0K0G4Z0_STRVS